MFQVSTHIFDLTPLPSSAGLPAFSNPNLDGSIGCAGEEGIHDAVICTVNIRGREACGPGKWEGHESLFGPARSTGPGVRSLGLLGSLVSKPGPAAAGLSSYSETAKDHVVAAAGQTRRCWLSQRSSQD
jgi:hypothetical protein